MCLLLWHCLDWIGVYPYVSPLRRVYNISQKGEKGTNVHKNGSNGLAANHHVGRFPLPAVRLSIGEGSGGA